MDSIQATVTRTVFKNEETGFAVLELENNDGEQFTAVGILALAMDGEKLELFGEWTVHPEYGKQFKAETFTTMLPTTRDGIVKYLSSSAVYGIGKAMAKRIVEHFGDDTMEVLNYHTERLIEIEGIGKKKLKGIIESLQRNQGMREVMLFMQTYGITPLFATKIYNKYGKAAIKLVKENPYILAEEIDGIGFLTADKVARSMGIDPTSPLRVNASVQYILKRSAGDGHTYLPKNILIEQIQKITDVSSEIAENAIVGLALKNKIAIVECDGKKNVYYEAFYYAEKYIANKILSTLSGSLSAKPVDRRIIDSCCSEYERVHRISLHPEQYKAVLSSATTPISIITGGPGTGKTTIIKCLIDIFEKEGSTVSLAAPTGRAAKRMAQTTDRTAQTIHRLLEYDYNGDDSFSFSRNDSNPLECDVLIIDEMSMVDTMLMFYVLKAMSPTMRLILVGDADQLPSVGPGNILSDLLASNVIPSTKLIEIYRQDSQSSIVLNAHRINNGEMPVISSKQGDFFLMKRYNLQQIVDTLVDIVVKRLNDYYGYEPIKDIQVLSPTRKGICGVANLNKVLQASLNPPDYAKNEYEYRDNIFREGDRIMQIKNNYTIEWESEESNGTGIFNGDMGVITVIDNEEETMHVEMDDGKKIEYRFAWLDELELAYATTVHKSQGNQFPVVVMPLAGGSNMLFSKSLLYTGITRAEKLVILVGKEEVLSFMVSNDYRSVRYTGLANMFNIISDATPNTFDSKNTQQSDDERNDVDVDEFAAIDWSDLIDF